MRSEERSFSYPDSREDCDKLEDCSKCGRLVDHLFDGIPLTCYCPRKSHKILGGLM